MTSLWLDRPDVIADDLLDPDEELDVVIVGAGLTGLVTALMLAQSGHRVAVVEARTVGAVATGNTTAKVSLLQGTKLSKILERQSQHVVQAYVDGNREGQSWLLRFCGDHDVPVQTRDAVTYAAAPDEVQTVRGELEAARSLGLDASWADSIDVPFPSYGAVILPGQSQFDPMDVLTALVSQLRLLGGTVHQGRRVVKASYGERPKLSLDDGTFVRADNVVLATGTPILDRGLYFAKLEPQRSYALAFKAPDVPAGMYLSAGQPTKSIRSAPQRPGADRLLVGGNGHGVGRTGSERAHVDELRDWTARHFPGAVETHVWSAQDYGSHDGIPYVGKLPRGGGHIFVATGYDKWGMTNAVAAARNISCQILGQQPPNWAGVLGRRITRPRGVAHGISINVGAGVAAVRSLVSAETHPAPVAPTDGSGAVGRSAMMPTGVSNVDGTTCAVLAICTHLGGVLRWNDESQTWDCPLHGSRFAPDGSVLEGPATRKLTTREAPEPQST